MRSVIRWCLTCVAAAAAAGEIAPEPIIGGAEAVLRINDLSWLERTAAQFATTSGGSPDRLRAQIAQSLFATRTLEGIDTSRTAILAWRQGPAPWTAIIPLKDRQRFLDEFGVAHAELGPLVRVGERNGTIVYTQNTRLGLWEYRLLLQDGMAFIARNVEECQQLAARQWRPANGAPPLAFRASGAWFAAEDRLSALAPLLPEHFADLVLPRAWPLSVLVRDHRAVMAQVASVGWEITAGKDGDVLWRAVAQPKPESLLAQWVAGQKNQGSRLLAALRAPEAIALGYGRLVWQGHLERWLHGQLEREHQAAPWLPAEADDALRTIAAVWEGAGAFAYATAISPRRNGAHAIDAQWLMESPRASELVAADRSLGRLLAKAAPPLANGGVPVREEHDAVLGGWSGHRVVTGLEAQPLLEDAVLANDRFGAGAHAAADAAMPAMQRVLERCAQNAPPEGVPALAGVQIRCTQWVRARLRERGETPPPLAEVEAGLALIATPQGALAIEAHVPLGSLAVMVRDSGITAERATPAPAPAPRSAR